MSPLFRSLYSALRASLALVLSVASLAYAHSVGQVQTTKFFAPETVQMLLDRAAAGTPGFKAGDTVSYIIQFTPIANGATVGAGGYVTDYIPAGTRVTGAWFVQPSGTTYVPVAPDLPGPISNGWGPQNEKTFTSIPFNTNAYDSRCSAAPAAVAGRCNGSLAQIYADTGIFYSSSPATAVFTAPNTDGRVRQGCVTNNPAGNGYNIDPTENNLNGILGQSCATTHNQWDADQTRAFGSTTGVLAAPSSSVALSGNGGRGTTPFNAGSAVAGPQSGYQLDHSGNVGPWYRISYPGSRIGNPTGRATSATASGTTLGIVNSAAAIVGEYTTAGWNLGSSPLPSNVNAVRWAVGQLVVGQLRYVKINLILDTEPPATGLINNSEVFGGDSAQAAGENGIDNPWRYHVPSVADNNSNLSIIKRVVCVYNTAGVCVAGDGANIPASAKVRYRITYVNSSNGQQNNMVLSDTLPTQATAAGNAVVVSGANILPTTPAISTTPTLTPLAGGTIINFATLNSLNGGGGGSVEFDVQMNNANTGSVSNKAKVVTTQLPVGATSFAVSTIVPTAYLVTTKTTSTPTVAAGGTATYTITITNSGAATATAIRVYDFLPTLGGTTSNINTRFSYASTGAITGLTAVVPTLLVPPNQVPFNLNANQQQVLWDFTGQSLAAGASATITFNATVGANVPANSTAYTNDIRVIYNAGSVDAAATAGVIVTSPLTISKVIECFFVGSTCTPYSGSGVIPVNAKLRYRIDYANPNAAAISNVVLTDTLPCQTAANAVTAITVVSGPISAPPLPMTSPGICPATRQTFSFPTLASLPANASGSIRVEVQTNATSGTFVTNTAGISGTGAALTTADASANVFSLAQLNISKSTATPSVSSGGTAAYTLTVTNTGTADATGIVVYDWLPTSSPTANPATRFTFQTGTTSLGGAFAAATPSILVSVPPTLAPYNSLATNPNMNNQEQIAWTFAGQTLTPGASFTITFNALPGAAMPASPPVYFNDARVVFAGGASSAIGQAGVSVVPPLAITKTIDCVFSGVTCVPYDGSGVIPSASKVRYKIVYQNISAIPQSNVVLTDTLPCQTAANAVSNIQIVSGPITLPSPNPPVTLAGACSATRRTVTFPTLGTLPPMTTGEIKLDVQLAANADSAVYNTATIVSTQSPAGDTSTVLVTAVTTPILSIVKTTSTPTLSPGGTASYTLTVTNTSAVTANALKIFDFLPTSGGASANAATRFTFTGTSSATLAGSPVSPVITLSVPPTQSPFSTNANQQEILWNFGAATLAPGAAIVINYTATIGNMVPTPISYPNNALVTSTNPGGVATASTGNTAAVMVVVVYTVAGNVYADANHSGTLDGEVGTGVMLCAKLIVGSTVAYLAPIDPVTGAYTITNVPAGNYTLIVDSNNCLVGSPDITPTPPAGFLGTEAPTGTRSISVMSNILNQNFGFYNGAKISGTVFRDTGAPSGTPNDAIQNGGEVGIPFVTVRALNGACAVGTCDTAITDALGNYTLWVPAVVGATPVQIVETNLPGNISTGGTGGTTGGTYVRSTDTTTATLVAGSSYTGVNFADVTLPSFTNDGMSTVAAGGSVFYPHTFVPGSGGLVTFSTMAVTTLPNQGWVQALFLDANCNGQLDVGEPNIMAPLMATAGVPICILMKQLVPFSIPSGPTNLVTVTASFDYTNAMPALNSTLTHTDLTTVGNPDGLVLMKVVDKASAKPGETLTYTITYSNTSTTTLSMIKVNDVTPTYTKFSSATCIMPLPMNIAACAATTQPAVGGTGGIEWLLTGTLAPMTSGSVQFVVTIN